VEKVEEVTGKSIDKKYSEARKGEYAQAYADISKAEKVLGWKPTHTIEDSVKSLVTWYTKKPDGWER
ncbi:MAG: GDP-mannose 4,6-dehydratase, partial [Candidatus Roizmanbacteria bacterium]